MKIERILFPTDFSETANHALTQAVELALAHRAALHVFHAVLLHSEDPGELEALLRDYVERVETDARSLLEESANEIRGRGVHVTFSTARGVSPFESIMDTIQELEPDLVVMGTHGRGGVGRLLLGSVTEKVLRYSPRPVLTLRHDAQIAVEKGGLLDRVLVPVDFTDYSRRALEAAQGFVSENGSLILLHVVSSPIHPSFYAGSVTRLFQIDPELPVRIEEKLSEWLGDRKGEAIAAEGYVHSEVMRVAEEKKVQLIAVGTRGLTGVDHLLLGSVAEKVVRTAMAPVLVVK